MTTEATLEDVPNEFKTFKSDIVLSKWEDDELDIIARDLSVKELRTFVLSRMSRWMLVREVGQDLWEAYREKFEGWTRETFTRVSSELCRRLATFLRERGVLVSKVGDARPLGVRLEEVLKEESMKEWTVEEVESVEKEGEFRQPFNAKALACVRRPSMRESH